MDQVLAGPKIKFEITGFNQGKTSLIGPDFVIMEQMFESSFVKVLVFTVFAVKSLIQSKPSLSQNAFFHFRISRSFECPQFDSACFLKHFLFYLVSSLIHSVYAISQNAIIYFKMSRLEKVLLLNVPTLIPSLFSP